jgi:hypothetical protein
MKSTASKPGLRHLNSHLNFSSGFQVIAVPNGKIGQNLAKILGTSLTKRFQQLITCKIKVAV